MKPVPGVHEGENLDAATPVFSIPPEDDRLLVGWLEEQSDLTRLAHERLDELLRNAAQPRHLSGNACIKLCYFVEQCRSSKTAALRDVAFSEKTAIDLFNFYIEWTEKNQHRSMRQVLELLASLIGQNPNEEIADSVKAVIAQRLLSILCHQSAQPLVKPAFKSLESLLGKGTISTGDLIYCYEESFRSLRCDSTEEFSEGAAWDLLIAEIFEWMTLPDVSPAAGKLLVTLFVRLRKESGISYLSVSDHTVQWQRWIRRGLSKSPAALDHVKNYLFPPLFKFDPSGSLLFLEDLNSQGPLSGLRALESNAHSLLHLAAIEVGKKSGLVEDPGSYQLQKGSKRPTKCVVLEESVIGSLMTHSSDTVRSLAFSVMVSSSSSIRPYSIVAMNLLQAHMPILYADTDAKFRNDVLSNTRHMIERCRGATAYLTRDIDNRNLLRGSNVSVTLPPENSISKVSDDTDVLLEMHKRFIQCFVEFVLAELIPTASYQRHITALKAIALLLRSGILEHGSKASVAKAPDNSSVWPYAIKFFMPGTMRLLLDLLMDPFEDVRINAGVVLKFASSEDFAAATTSKISNAKKMLQQDSDIESIKFLTNKVPELLWEFISRGQDLSKRTGRADYADGLARSYDILYTLSPSLEDGFVLVEELIDQLERKIKICEEDLAQAVLDAPIHGIFAALNFVWTAVDASPDFETSSQQNNDQRARLDQLQIRMLNSCRRIWVAIQDVLCNDSPEGHLPQDIDEVDEIDTKNVLSYSFRAIHESSKLMMNLASRLTSIWRDGQPVLPVNVFSGVGHLTFEQLSTLRHRGAFSTVSLTFAKCCQLTQHRHSAYAPHQKLLEEWYQSALQCMSEQASTTRRSAGMPALITGILSSNARTPAFDSVMNDLKDVAKRPVRLSKLDETRLPQVHAMNCLKEVFKSSVLGKRSEAHVADCLQIAADSLNSEVYVFSLMASRPRFLTDNVPRWAIRNCGLLLLRSLIDALFGTNESKVITEAGWDGRSIKLSYDNHPALPELLLKLLETKGEVNKPSMRKISSVESMFPALDIIRRAGPPSTHRDEIYKSVSVHLGSNVWHVREIAARSICTLLLHDGWLAAVLELIETSNTSTNRLHGVLMAVKLVLERRLALNIETATDGLDQLASILKSSKMWSFFESGCPEILAAYLEVSNSIAQILLRKQNTTTHEDSQLTSVMDHLFQHDTYEEFLDLMKTYPSLTASIGGSECSVNTALACKAIVCRSIFTAALRNDTLGLRNVISFAAALDTDIALTAIEVIPMAWGGKNSVGALSGLTKAYIGSIEMTQCPEVRSTAILNLAKVVDRLFESINSSNGEREKPGGATKLLQHPSLDLNEIIRVEIKNLGALLQDGKRTPALSNAEIRISGSLIVCEYVSQKHFNRALDTYKPRMEAWGKLLAGAGVASNDFDTRHAAAAALASFYRNPYFEWYIPSDECVLPSMFALYDTLNDDDDEIRNLSADTVSTLLRKFLVPLAARVELAEYISKMHLRARSFAWNVVRRITGSRLETVDNIRFRLQPVGPQLSSALRDDNSLFVQEEQNLFIDEVREAKLWSKTFEDTGLDTWSGEQADFDIENIWQQPHAALATWVIEGLLALNARLVEYDGPLGWTSKPMVFALITRLLISANAIIQRHEGLITSATGRPVPGNRIIGGIIFALEQFITLSHNNDNGIHESLLLEVQGKPSLPLNSLHRIIPDISKLIRENVLFTSETSRS